MRGWLVGLAVLAFGCKESKLPVIHTVAVDAFDGRDVVGFGEAELIHRTRTALARAGMASRDGKPGLNVMVAVAADDPSLHRGAPLQVRVALAVQFESTTPGFSVEQRKVAQPGVADVDAIQHAMVAALEASLASASSEVASVILLTDRPIDAVRAALASSVETERKAAVRVLVARGDAAAVQPLLNQLKSDDLDDVRGAIGALEELKRPEAVNPIISAAQRIGPTFEREIVFAVASIGGDDAEAYLDLVSSGSDDPALRAAAAIALKELRAQPTKHLP